MFKTVVLVMVLTIILVLTCENSFNNVQHTGLKKTIIQIWNGTESHKTIPTPKKITPCPNNCK